MNYLFRKHYTLNEARQLLPKVREWLTDLKARQAKFEGAQEKLDALMGLGRDVGGEIAGGWVRSLAGIQEVLMQFHRREIQVKDVQRGLVDFPSKMGSKEVFLCWEEGEDDIEFWHELDAGYAGRQRLKR
jgi:hypothetical protein